MEENKLDAIIRKVKGLMAIANDAASDDEAQSAFLLAQKLMLKHNIEQSTIEDAGKKEDIVQGQASAYKTVFWYEKLLASIVSKNFRVKGYLNMKRVHENDLKYKSTVVFFGLVQDVKIAKEIFILASEAIVLYAKRYIDNYYIRTGKPRTHKQTADLKNSYMRGFLSGLENKLDEQRFSLQEEFGLVLLTPKVVEDEYAAFSTGFKGASNVSMPCIEEATAYKAGYSEGEQIDYTKSTINDDIFNI